MDFLFFSGVMIQAVAVTILAARLLLTAIFLLAGSTKLVDPAGSRNALRDSFADRSRPHTLQTTSRVREFLRSQNIVHLTRAIIRRIGSQSGI